MTNNFQMFWILWKSTRPNLKQLYIAFHSEKFTFLLHLSKFSPRKSDLRGSNILSVNEKSMTNNYHQFWTLRKSTRSNLILLYMKTLEAKGCKWFWHKNFDIKLCEYNNMNCQYFKDNFTTRGWIKCSKNYFNLIPHIFILNINYTEFWKCGLHPLPWFHIAFYSEKLTFLLHLSRVSPRRS